jgi:hypothetical protein
MELLCSPLPIVPRVAQEDVAKVWLLCRFQFDGIAYRR